MREKERVGWIERLALTYMHYCVSNIWLGGNCLIVQGAQLSVLWWSRGVGRGLGEPGMKAQEGRIDAYLWLIHVVVSQKLTQLCKAIILQLSNKLQFLKWCSGKEPLCECRRHRRQGFSPWVGKIPARRKWQSALVFLPGKFYGQKHLAGYSPSGHKESDMTEHTYTHTHTHTHLSINVTPLLFSC